MSHPDAGVDRDLVDAVERSLAATGPSEVPAGLAARAVRVALAARQPRFLDRLIAVGWRAVAVATAGAILLLILTGRGADVDVNPDELISEVDADSYDPTAELLGVP